MTENISNTQIGSHNTQIGQQNNNLYLGMSPEKACEIAMNLFWDNFPKLQQQAMEKVEQLVKEFCDTTVNKIIQEKITDLSPFSTPDMQYILVDAQNSYARFGNDALLSNLSTLIVQRVKFDKNDYMKIVLDRAIQIIPNLSKQQIDTLTLMFYFKKVKFNNIRTCDDLKNHIDEYCDLFSTCSFEGYSLLNSLGCLDLDLASIPEKLSDTYSLDIEDVKRLCPDKIKNLHPDYSPSHVGIIIAIANSKQKTNLKFKAETWIHD